MASMATSTTKATSTKRSAKPVPRSVAFITIGRWEPPHQGHEVIGTRTIDWARTYNKKRGFNSYSDVRNNPAVPIMWISPVGDHRIPTDKRNPLTTLQRLYYLKRMFPRTKYPDLEFLTDLKNIGHGFEELLNTGDNSGLTKFENRKKNPKNWDEMTPCQKYKYKNIMDWTPVRKGGRWNNKIRPTRKAGLDPNDLEYRRLPSKQCLHFLAKNKFKQVSIVVGSDRAAAFEKYNRKDFDLLFPGEGRVVLGGDERGVAGKGQPEEKTSSSAPEEEKRVISCKSNLIPISIKREKSDDEKALSHAMEDFTTKEVFSQPMEDTTCDITELEESMEQLTISRPESDRRAPIFSGTRTRKAAYNGEVNIFITAVQKGNMSFFDCFCLMNDIREWGQRDKLRGDKPAQIEASKLEGLSLLEFYLQLDDKHNEYYYIQNRRSVFLKELQDLGLDKELDLRTRDDGIPWTQQMHKNIVPEGLRLTKKGKEVAVTEARTKAQQQQYTPKQLKDIRKGKIKINGGRRKTRRKKKRKTRRRRKKRRKSIKKLKLRLTKHRKKRFKKWKVKKTRRN